MSHFPVIKKNERGNERWYGCDPEIAHIATIHISCPEMTWSHLNARKAGWCTLWWGKFMPINWWYYHFLFCLPPPVCNLSVSSDSLTSKWFPLFFIFLTMLYIPCLAYCNDLTGLLASTLAVLSRFSQSSHWILNM